MTARESRPDGDRAASRSTGEELKSTLASRGDISGRLDVHAVLVVTPTGNVRRRLYLSLHSAEKAAARATAAGHHAELHLCRVVPVGGEDR
jgi:hypothetical protein